ncbi:DUF262 domain-containing protein [uncultured Thiodictyon sp.]|uniref:DUF262 domain-containing protein n=1 Tax=uncultured Thiodictyon sp. TaxID=1846217 RepID=UPI0025CF4E59|nr:DUF262 domain-containing protein [uncultured Thiodictyon sp.]
MSSTPSGAAALLTLAQIAAWQVAHAPAKPGPIIAALPAFQRGAVWKVEQIEELWDSILRRFPIGSFVIAPPNDALKKQDFKLQSDQDGLPVSTHLLLDGQQRATGIALGFYDIWKHDIEEAKSVLWLDLTAPPENREAEYIFRVVTRAHPWGYKLTNPDETLSAHQIRAALQAFRAANRVDGTRPEEFSLLQTWPWDAEAPVPLVLLIDVVSQHSGDLVTARAAAWKRIQGLPMFTANPVFRNEEMGGRVENDARQGLEKQCQGVRDAFEKPDSKRYHRLDFILQRLQGLLATEADYLVPALPLDLQDAAQRVDQTGEDEVSVDAVDAAKKDAIELLFVRVNSAGTPLAGEELTYSLLKAAWPDAAKFIDGLKHKPALGSRIAMLCVRLVLARQQVLVVDEKKLAMPPTPGVNEFRRLVRNQNPAHPNFYDELRTFIEKDANELFSATWEFLSAKSKSYALLPVLAVEMAQKSPDVYFLLLRWIDRLRTERIGLDTIDDAIHRRTLGFLTALAWFAPDKGKACAAIWTELQADVRGQQLIDRFNNTRFRMACRLDDRLNQCMIPLPSVEELELACRRGVTGQKGIADGIARADNPIWTNWNWYVSFADILVKDRKHRVRWADRLRPRNILVDGRAPDLTESTLQAARHFLDTLHSSRPVLLYAQREWLRKWYPGFDPSQPEYMEDKNRPWDYDHLLPQNLLRGEAGYALRNIPPVILDWCGSIGNLRAWPLELNRADRDISPTLKLTEIWAEETRYWMVADPDKRAASFVREKKRNPDWPLWKNSVPMNADNVAHHRYLALPEYHEYRRDLVKAIVWRFVALYREWYDKLKIGELQR